MCVCVCLYLWSFLQYNTGSVLFESICKVLIEGFHKLFGRFAADVNEPQENLS